jgi:hypothetical protein
MSQTQFNILFFVMLGVGAVLQVFVIYGLAIGASSLGRSIRVALESPRLNERTGRLARFAEKAGIAFQPEVDPSVLDSFPFRLFRLARFRIGLPGVTWREPLRNMFQWRADGAEFWLFDFRYRMGKGGPITQTVCLITSPALRLPRFTLRPELRLEETLEKFLPMLAAIATTKDIDFEHAPEFSQDYFLSSDDEPATRKLFDNGPIACISQLRHRYTIDGEGERFLIYRSRITLDEAEIAAFVEDAANVYRSLVQQKAPAVA